MAVGCSFSLAGVEVYEAQHARVMTGPGGRPKHGWRSKCHRPVASCYRHRPIWAERLLSTGAPPAIHHLGPRAQHASPGTTLTPIHQDLLWVTGKEETNPRFIISRKTNTKKKYTSCHGEVVRSDWVTLDIFHLPLLDFASVVTGFFGGRLILIGFDFFTKHLNLQPPQRFSASLMPSRPCHLQRWLI